MKIKTWLNLLALAVSVSCLLVTKYNHDQVRARYERILEMRPSEGRGKRLVPGQAPVTDEEMHWFLDNITPATTRMYHATEDSLWIEVVPSDTVSVGWEVWRIE
jgi:hypothetical protein